MRNPAPVVVNDIHKLLCNFDIPTDHLISTRRPDLKVINNKQRTCKIVDFSDHRIKLKKKGKEG